MTVKGMTDNPILILVAGAKGAIGSTVAAAVSAMKEEENSVAHYLTAKNWLGVSPSFDYAGWDEEESEIRDIIRVQGIVPEQVYRSCGPTLDKFSIKSPPHGAEDFSSKVHQLKEDIREFQAQYPGSMPVFVNLLPAAPGQQLWDVSTLEDLLSLPGPQMVPDMAYITAAILSDIPVVNFTPNKVEIPCILEEARRRKIPISGRDGKTGQTYLKVVLASALKARNLWIDGWYSLNILGNADGRNLMDPQNVQGKLKNKTDFLDDILGYPVGAGGDGPSHKVHIDYYPPRGDAKEAWDVVDFKGIFGMPMSLRLNLQGRDSILAAPLVLDLCCWMAALKQAGRGGPVAELAFYFKKTVGQGAPVTFEDQLQALNSLSGECAEAGKE